MDEFLSQISGSIVAPEDPELWDGLNPHKWLYFHGVNHLTVEGGGRVNGMGRKWWAQSCKTNSSNVRPTLALKHTEKDYVGWQSKILFIYLYSLQKKLKNNSNHEYVCHHQNIKTGVCFYLSNAT